MDIIPNWDLAPPKLSWKEKVAYVAYQLSQLPQNKTPVEHLFAPGVYIREMKIPAHTLFVGRGHTYGHLVQLIEGSVILVGPDGRIRIDAPFQIQTRAGTHVVVYTLTDVWCRTVHPNVMECRDTELLENDCFESAEDLLALGKHLYNTPLEYVA